MVWENFMKRIILVLMMCVQSLLHASFQVRDGFDPIATYDLFEAVYDNNRGRAKNAIKAGADVQAINSAKTPLLHIVVSQGALEMAELLIANGADVNVKNSAQISSLHVAAICNVSNVAEFLIARGAKVNMGDISGWTPLHWAAENNRLGVAVLLIAKNANVNAQAKNGSVPLHMAVKNNAFEMIELLIVNGAEIPDILSDQNVDFLDAVIRNINQKRAEEFAVLSALSALEAKGVAFNKKNMPAGLLKSLCQIFVSQRCLSPLRLASGVIAQRRKAAEEKFFYAIENNSFDDTQAFLRKGVKIPGHLSESGFRFVNNVITQMNQNPVKKLDE